MVPVGNEYYVLLLTKPGVGKRQRVAALVMTPRVTHQTISVSDDYNHSSDLGWCVDIMNALCFRTLALCGLLPTTACVGDD